MVPIDPDPMPLRILRALVFVLAFATMCRGQADSGAGGPETGDPYTKGSPKLLERAGYVGYGPFAIGAYHGTREVDALLGDGRMMWLETEHFKLGTDLPSYPVRGESRQRKKIRAELTELARVFPAIDVGTDELGPWLRMHLLARRCESLYDDFQKRLGHSDADFPPPGKASGRGDAWMGLGPYLGQSDKFVVVITTRSADLGRYSAQYLGRAFRWPQRYNIGWKRSLLFATSIDFEGGLEDDTALHAHVVYNLVHNFCDGYRHLCHETPVWFKTGLAQWYLREIDERYPNFDRPPEGRPRGRLGPDWQEVARGLALHRAATPLSEMATWRDYAAFDYHDYVAAWSRVSYLISEHGHTGVASYLFRMKALFGTGRGTPDWERVLARQEGAIADAFGFEDLDALDAAWRVWITSARSSASRR